jgi:hypothetical protein
LRSFDDSWADGGWESTGGGLRRFGKKKQSWRRLRVVNGLRSEKVRKMAEITADESWWIEVRAGPEDDKGGGGWDTRGSLKLALTEMVPAKILLREPPKAKILLRAPMKAKEKSMTFLKACC